MSVIVISSFTNEAASKTKGIVLREKLEELITSKESITVDFDGISRFASPFFNNSFASLAIVYGFDVIKNITLVNISDTGKDTYDTSLENAKLLVEKPEFLDEINKIVSNAPKKAE